MFYKTRKKYLNGIVLIILSITIFINGCASPPYSRVKFCWTTNHRIPPEDRMVSVNATPLAVRNALVKWALFYQGEVILDFAGYDKIITLRPDSSKNFQMAHDIFEKEWNSYKINRVRKWEKEEWLRFMQLSKKQIEETSSAGKGYKLFVKTRERMGEIWVKEQTGSKVGYTPPIITYSWGTPTGVVGGMPVEYGVYETIRKTRPFYSIVRFFIFENKGKTYVYAYALPVEGESQTEARYGVTIGYRWYKFIDARVEAEMVRDALNYLRNLEQADKLSQFALEKDIDPEEACEKDCRKMIEKGELRQGMTVEECIKMLCK